MLPLLSECWRLAQYLLRPEATLETAGERPAAAGSAGISELAGIAKALFWAGLAVLAGLGLGQLHG